jgi:hypothetical protein
LEALLHRKLNLLSPVFPVNAAGKGALLEKPADLGREVTGVTLSARMTAQIENDHL